MNPILEQILSFLQLCLQLLNEALLAPILNLILRRLKNNADDEVSITINISSRPSSSSLPRLRKQRPRVKFGKVEVRTHESILGDNPSCSRGPPMSIGWNVQSTSTTSVDAFESHPDRADRPQYEEYDLLMERSEREYILLALGYTKSEIAATTRRILKDKKRRRQTADNITTAYVEEKVEGIKKSLRRRFLLKNGTKKLYKEWKKVDKLNQEELASAETEANSESMTSWHRTNSILVLGRKSSMSSNGSSSMGGLLPTLKESLTNGSVESDIPKSIRLDPMTKSTSTCKLSSVRRGKSNAGFMGRACRRSSM